MLPLLMAIKSGPASSLTAWLKPINTVPSVATAGEDWVNLPYNV
jgi:hypothetical protein